MFAVSKIKAFIIKHYMNILDKYAKYKYNYDIKKLEKKSKKKIKIKLEPYQLIIILLLVLSLISPFFIILLLAYLLIPLIYLILRNFQSKKLFSIMKNNSLMICGAKGKGKDLLIQAYVNSMGKNYCYYSNINYGACYNVLNYKDLDLNNNDYTNLIDNKINKLHSYSLKENADIIISDCGIYFPSQYDFYLKKIYKSLPIFIALSRQLGNHNVIINSQAFGRTWLILREQFDCYILCKHTTLPKVQQVLKFLPFVNHYLFVRCYFYEQQESFQRKLVPFDKSGFVSRNNAIYSTTADTLKKQYDFENGLIREFIVPINKKKIKYNTREFAYKFFDKNILKERGFINE